MENVSYDYEAQMKMKTSVYSPKADYDSAMRIYKIFGCSSLFVLAVVYLLLQVL